MTEQEYRDAPNLDYPKRILLVNYTHDLKALLALFSDWLKCPSVNRERKYFYYRREAGIAYRIVQDRATDHWFLHISQN